MGDAERRELERLERLAGHMDRAFRVPGTPVRFGWDAVLGLVPGIGDTLALVPALYILACARRLGAPAGLMARMTANLGIDWAVGLVPLVGDIFDVGLKANSRNTALLRAHLEEGLRLEESPAR